MLSGPGLVTLLYLKFHVHYLFWYALYFHWFFEAIIKRPSHHMFHQKNVSSNILHLLFTSNTAKSSLSTCIHILMYC